ncbi:MAG: Rieske 2Fe-2S domain-containing protein [Chloroflexota bacterium]
MLSTADNQQLCQVGPGTPMGDLLRQYWMPMLLSEELPAKDGPPLRVKLLGELLVAYRDTSGQVGLMADNCPHRGASMFFGRNEEAGLRCVYHGWKFDLTGACTDMPNEPAESNFKNKVRITAYQTRERNGVIWAYLGPEEAPPALPELEWNLVPENQRYISKRLGQCNWVQSLEGGIDTSHSGFLHRPLAKAVFDPTLDIVQRDRTPRFEVMETDYGVLIGARRGYDDTRYSWGITQFLMPFYSMIPGGLAFGPSLGGHAWVPMDDETTMTWTVSWHPDRPLTEQEIQGMHVWPNFNIHVGREGGFLAPTSEPGGAWRTVLNKQNDYLIDHQMQQELRYIGINNIGLQDQCVQESMGPIYDRTREHLGAADTAIIRVRNLWLRSARALREQGLAPVGALSPEAYRVRSHGLILEKADAHTWIEASAEFRRSKVWV